MSFRDRAAPVPGLERFCQTQNWERVQDLPSRVSQGSYLETVLVIMKCEPAWPGLRAEPAQEGPELSCATSHPLSTAVLSVLPQHSQV